MDNQPVTMPPLTPEVKSLLAYFVAQVQQLGTFNVQRQCWVVSVSESLMQHWREASKGPTNG